MKRYRLLIGMVIFIMLILFQFSLGFIIEPYISGNFNLNPRDILYIKSLCYLSAIYGAISVAFINWLEKKSKDKRK